MLRFLGVFFTSFLSLAAISQAPKTYTSSELLLQLKKLNVLGSVLYVAAHPDDENTRLLAYLANEKLYRTGYLSLTRGDGGQNLIGDEQGVELGLIRTQELLSARRIDGAEQFFSRAYDFGFSKSAEEALAVWGHEKILSDVVWVVRKFRPDVLIARFPEDSRAGHGHHAASGILAREAFDAAADPTRFPEQLSQGVTVWQPKRLLWNTFNFGNTNTQSEDQFKLDVGMFNPLLGKGYGEIAALSRSQHKSQGFGVPAQRGSVLEYFTTIKGEKPVADLMEGVLTNWKRTAADKVPEKNAMSIQLSADSLVQNFDPIHPDKSVAGLVRLYKTVSSLGDSYWKTQKLKDIQNLVEFSSGLFLDATTSTQYGVSGDTLKVSAVVNNRSGIALSNVQLNTAPGKWVAIDSIQNNVNKSYNYAGYIDPAVALSQPYWLQTPMELGSFNVADQQLIGTAENKPLSVVFKVTIDQQEFVFEKPVRFKYTDPVRGELYQPVSIVPVADVKFEKDVYLFKEKDSMHVVVNLLPNGNGRSGYQLETALEDKANGKENRKFFPVKSIERDKPQTLQIDLPREKLMRSVAMSANLSSEAPTAVASTSYKRVIAYEHIPLIVYQRQATTKPVFLDFKVAGKAIGYIPGAGDKVPQALAEMGYKVTMLHQGDIRSTNLKQFDAIVTGVRAYNTNEWMNSVYDQLMEYVEDGGILLSQYNTSNQIGPVKAKIAPFPFSISRNRVTDEKAPVTFLQPEHAVLNFPNKITAQDFDGWIQERSIYNAEKIDSNYKRILSMKDEVDKEQQDGSLIVADYGKGRIIYTGLVFFRQLPAGVPGAYRLFANLVASPMKPAVAPKGTTQVKTAVFKPKKAG
ncbi:MAG: PIG-L family deacetylase [Bacteroidota bacterium]